MNRSYDVVAIGWGPNGGLWRHKQSFSNYRVTSIPIASSIRPGCRSWPRGTVQVPPYEIAVRTVSTRDGRLWDAVDRTYL